MTQSFKMIVPCLRLTMKQKARVPMPSITTQGAVVSGYKLSLFFYFYTAKTAGSMKITHRASKSLEILQNTKAGIHWCFCCSCVLQTQFITAKSQPVTYRAPHAQPVSMTPVFLPLHRLLVLTVSSQGNRISMQSTKTQVWLQRCGKGEAPRLQHDIFTRK